MLVSLNSELKDLDLQLEAQRNRFRSATTDGSAAAAVVPDLPLRDKVCIWLMDRASSV